MAEFTRPTISGGVGLTGVDWTVKTADGATVLTIEGVAHQTPSGEQLHPVQQAFWDHHGLQCGFCTPGMIISALQLLQDNPHPSEADIRHGIVGNLCRCTGYQNIVRAIDAAAREPERLTVTA